MRGIAELDVEYAVLGSWRMDCIARWESGEHLGRVRINTPCWAAGGWTALPDGNRVSISGECESTRRAGGRRRVDCIAARGAARELERTSQR
jgi:hypothetical protein